MQLSNMQFNILKIGSCYQTIDPNLPAPDLKNAIRPFCIERFRRIDHYIQLALLGSGRCVEDTEIKPDTALYFGSRFAAINNSIQLQERLIAHAETPKPANFINTLSNTAGYFVARNLGLKGRNLFVSREDASFHAALQLAHLDMATGAIDQALIGVVDEAGLPVKHHCQRLGVAPNTPLGEGSHWFLLQRDNNENTAATLTGVHTLFAEHEVENWLSKNSSGEDDIFWFATPKARNLLAAAQYQMLPPQSFYNPGLNYYPGLLAGAIAHYDSSPEMKPLLAIDADSHGRFHVARFQKLSAE